MIVKRSEPTILPAVIIAFLAFAGFPSCNKGANQPAPPPERELSVPEKVEKELTDLLSKDWTSLADTLSYFDSTLLSKGRFKGKGPDGIYYELRITANAISEIKADFRIEDSSWVAVTGKAIPLGISLYAFETTLALKAQTQDSTSLSVSKVKAVAPNSFFSEPGHRAALFYEGLSVGFITREEFENTDYTTGTYLVIHYYDDPRTFALYDNGFAKLLKIDIKDVLK